MGAGSTEQTDPLELGNFPLDISSKWPQVWLQKD